MKLENNLFMKLIQINDAKTKVPFEKYVHWSLVPVAVLFVIGRVADMGSKLADKVYNGGYVRIVYKRLYRVFAIHTVGLPLHLGRIQSAVFLLASWFELVPAFVYVVQVASRAVAITNAVFGFRV